MNARTEKFNEMGEAGDTCEIDEQMMSESTVLDLAQPNNNVDMDAAEESPEDTHSEGKGEEEEKENEGGQKEGEATGEGDQQEGAMTGDVATEAGGHADNHENETEDDDTGTQGDNQWTGVKQGNPFVNEDNELEMALTQTTVNALRQKGETGREARARINLGEKFSNEKWGKGAPVMNGVVGEIYKRFEKAKEHVVTMQDPKERQKSWDMLHAGRLKEFSKMESQGVMEPASWSDTPAEHRRNRRVLRSLAQCHQKGDKSNVVTQWKARWCTDGSTAVKGMHYGQTSSPTPKQESIRLLCAEAALRMEEGDTSACPRQADVPSACTHWDEKHEIHFRAPKGEATFVTQKMKGEDVRIEVCFKFKKALCGMPSSGHAHYVNLRKFLEGLGLTTGWSDEATWTRGVENDPWKEK